MVVENQFLFDWLCTFKGINVEESPFVLVSWNRTLLFPFHTIILYLVIAYLSCLAWNIYIKVQELCESRGGRPGLSVLTSLLVSVDVKNY